PSGSSSRALARRGALARAGVRIARDQARPAPPEADSRVDGARSDRARAVRADARRSCRATAGQSPARALPRAHRRGGRGRRRRSRSGAGGQAAPAVSARPAVSPRRQCGPRAARGPRTPFDEGSTSATRFPRPCNKAGARSGWFPQRPKEVKMRARTEVLLLVLLAAVVVVSSALARSDPKGFTVTSTLDGKTVLPLRIRWRAQPQHVALAQIKEVDYLIDGRHAWTEHHTPYYYGSNEGNYGNWLVTSFLDPGLHTFTVRAVTRGGRTATDTVKARVLPAPAPPAKLAGAWTRIVTAADLKKGPPGPPAGRWTITVSSLGWPTGPAHNLPL